METCKVCNVPHTRVSCPVCAAWIPELARLYRRVYRRTTDLKPFISCEPSAQVRYIGSFTSHIGIRSMTYTER